MSNGENLRRPPPPPPPSSRSSWLDRYNETIDGYASTTNGLFRTITSSLLLIILNEKRRQRRLTKLPTVLYQHQRGAPSDSDATKRNDPEPKNARDGNLVVNNEDVVSLLSSTFLRSVRPKLFVGTRSRLNSFLAFVKRGPSPKDRDRDTTIGRIREIMTISYDGAKIALDWELPSRPDSSLPSSTGTTMEDVADLTKALNHYVDASSAATTAGSSSGRNRGVPPPKIKTPMVLLLPGLNTDSSHGYIRWMMKACVDRGWIAVTMNARGHGVVSSTDSRPIEISTPRTFSLGYTNDLRDVVNKICIRLEPTTPLFLVGFSAGANTMVKYLGEEGGATNSTGRTLPSNVSGAISIGNPFRIGDMSSSFPWTYLMLLGAKRRIFQQRKQLRQFHCLHFRKAIRDALFRSTDTYQMTSNTFPFLVRNAPVPPFETTIGFDSPEQYYEEGSSVNYIANVSVPTLVIVAKDDDLAYGGTRGGLDRCLSNPNVIVVETESGGHLGWHTHCYDGASMDGMDDDDRATAGFSWADLAATKFIHALLSRKRHDECRIEKELRNLSRDMNKRLHSRL